MTERIGSSVAKKLRIRLVVTWDHVYDAGNPSAWITFQIILHADGSLGIEYRRDGGPGPIFGSPLAPTFGRDDAALAIAPTAADEDEGDSGTVHR